jgi:geranylgeranyl pyrophosphate synthase
MDFTTKLRALVARVETGLDRYVPAPDTRPAILHAAMRYSTESGGKRIRPVIVLAMAEVSIRPPATTRCPPRWHWSVYCLVDPR